MTHPTLPPLAVLGAGSMGGAIIRGIVESGTGSTIIATNRTEEKARELSGLTGVESLALGADPGANLAAAERSDVILLGVKPAGIVELLREIAPAVTGDTLIVSLAAGVPIARCEAVLGDGVGVIRAMPNTPSLVGAGVTGLASGAAVTQRQRETATAIFETCGVVIDVPEAQIDALSTISGSGPAYVFLLIEKLTQAAREKGFDDAEARLMAEQTFIGACRLLDAQGEDPAELRRRVTSPKGTTERAVAVLEDAGLERIFGEATDAALERAREIAAE